MSDPDSPTEQERPSESAEKPAEQFNSADILARALNNPPPAPEIFSDEDKENMTRLQTHHGRWASRAYRRSRSLAGKFAEIAASADSPQEAVAQLALKKTQEQVAFRRLAPNLRHGLTARDKAELRNFNQKQIPELLAHLQKINFPDELRPLLELQLAVLDQYMTQYGRPDPTDPNWGNILPAHEFPVFAELIGPALEILSDIETQAYRSEYKEQVLGPTVDFLTENYPELGSKELARRAEQFNIRLETIIGVNLMDWDVVGGTYDSRSREIVIPRLDRGRRPVEIHETLHALSQGDSEDAFFGDRPRKKDRANRTGGVGNHLTEAIVETVTREIVPEAGKTNVYAEQRDTLERLRSWDLPERLANRPRPGQETGPIPLNFFVAALFDKPKALAGALQARGYAPEAAQLFLDAAEDMLNLPPATDEKV